MRRRHLLVVVLLTAISIGGISALYLTSLSGGCPAVLGQAVTRGELTPTTQGAVASYSLPSPYRSPNGISVAPDGSIWFGEQAVPGIGHLYPNNGTLVEYAFPGSYSGISNGVRNCADKTNIWGIALWNGSVWATDTANNRLLGLNPAEQSFKVISLAANDSFPYTLTPGPNDELWFTQVLSGQIGTVFANGTVAEHQVTHLEGTRNLTAPINLPGTPTQIVFANSSRGYYVDASPLVNGSAIYAFDPGRFRPQQVGGAQILHNPDSISLGNGGVWLAQHSASSIAFFDLKNDSWTVYPTSSVDYVGTTLPYFVETDGPLVWFNEHYGNRMAVLDSRSGTLTEYSVSSPPARNLSQIDNALTFALGGNKAWFTELTANKIGFVDASYKPPFAVSVAGTSSLSLHRGGEANVTIELLGNSSSPVSIKVSDPSGSITMRADKNEIGSLLESQSVNVALDVGQGAAPGRYTLLVTATDGLVSRSVYLELSILP